MTDLELQLVKAITQQVLAVLRERGLAGGDGAAARAEIHPPVGQCTGDYSKFPELAGRLSGAAAQPSAKPAEAQALAQAKTEPIPLAGIVTANQLQAAMAAAADGVAVLSAEARLTPLANDMLRKDPKRVRRVTAGGAARAVDPAALPWMWWIDGSCPVVQEVTTQRRERLRPASASHTPGALTQVVRDLAEAIRNRRVAGGLLFVHNAARATCMANRCASIRAVVATCGEAVEQGIQDLGANVLVIEYPHHGLRSASAMVDRMLQQPPQAPAAVERDLADLHRCG